MKRILVWGTGSFAQGAMGVTLVNQIADGIHYELAGFVDSDKSKWGMEFYGKEIYSPQKLNELDFDKVVILLGNQNYQAVYRQLSEEFHIPTEKIADFLWVVEEKGKLLGNHKSKQVREPKIYDCFPFFNEFELLSLRMELLDSYVDYFVLVEMGRTFRGKEKPCLFKEHEAEFDKYRDKIIYVCPKEEEIPIHQGGLDWSLEIFQRNCIMRGLIDCNPEDIIIISDTDEIPNPQILCNIKKSQYSVKKDVVSAGLQERALVCKQGLYYYYFNNKAEMDWYGSILVKYKNLVMPQELRMLREDLCYIENGGWHFTFFGSAEKVIEKTHSIADGIFCPNTDEEIRMNVKNGIAPGYKTKEEFPLSYIRKEEIGLDNIDDIITRYPQFYKML